MNSALTTRARRQSHWPPFAALPAYVGGKRRLCPLLFGLLSSVVPERDWPSLRFVDPFLGGGSVSLYAKARGFDVVANDLALRSAAIGRALLANNRRRISASDIAQLLKPSVCGEHRAEECFVPSVFSRPHAQLIDRALANLLSFDEPLRSLATLLLIKWILRIQPMSMLRGTDARAAFEGDLDQVSPRRLRHYVDSRRLLSISAWLHLADEVNTGVFPGVGQVYQEDARTFLAHAAGDVVYLDPPYPGTTSYEHEYAVLDILLESERRPVSAFSRSQDVLPSLFDACEHIPIWLISMNNAVFSREELEAFVRLRRRHVRSIAVPYRHLGSIASKEKNHDNQEFIVLATNQPSAARPHPARPPARASAEREQDGRRLARQARRQHQARG